MENGDRDAGPALSPTSLLCFETSDSLNGPSDEDGPERDQENGFGGEFNLSGDFSPQEDDEYVTAMLGRENGLEFGDSKGMSEDEKAWLKSVRMESIHWVNERRVSLGFRYRTVYLSIMYFDRFLSLEWTALKKKDWVMRLLALTCLSLAAKMEEVRVPAMSAYGAGYAQFDFPIDWIKKMELMVLYALQWEMGLISPFCFMHFFSRKFQPFPAGGGAAVSTIAGIIFESVTVASTMDFRPSVVAAAAALAEMDRELSKGDVEAKISRSSVSNYGFTTTIEQVHSCYELIKEIYPYNKQHDPKPLVKSPDRRDPGSSSGSSGVSDKRRRLSSESNGP